MSSGIGANTKKTKRISLALEEAIKIEMENSTWSNNSMNAGNLNASVEAVDQLSAAHSMLEDPPSQDEIQVDFSNLSPTHDFNPGHQTHIFPH